MMMFLVFSHYQQATDAPATTKAVPDCQQSPLWLVYVGQAITSNVLVRCDHQYLEGKGGPARWAIVFISSIAPGRLLLEQIKSMLRLLEQNKAYKQGYRSSTAVTYDV